MTNKTTEALKLAEEALVEYRDNQYIKAPRKAIAAIREVLAEQEKQEPVAWCDHVEHRLLTWRQSFVNRSGDQLALDDFMDQRSLEDLIDFVCDEYTAPTPRKPEPVEQEPVATDLMDMLRLIETIKYLRGIAERGLGREIREDETIEQFVLGYVKQLESTQPVKQEPVAWVDVSEQMPKPSKAVLIHYVINSPAYGGTRSGVIRALWIPAKTEESNDEDHFEYDEDTDTYYIPEGWYELVENWDEYSSVHVCEGDITHWMPLPEFPNAAPVSAKREWVDLTVSDLDAIIEKHYDDEMDLKAMILDGIAAFKDKNK